MTASSKRAIAPYAPLIAFANTEITEENWREVLQSLPGHPGKEMLEEFSDHYGKTALSALRINGQGIEGPQPLWAIQDELRADLVRLTDPTRDIVSAPPPVAWYEISPTMPEKQREHWTKSVNQIGPEPRKDLSWLRENIGSVFARRPIQLCIFSRRHNQAETRLLITDRIAVLPDVSDLYTWTYFQLARLWEDGLLSRLGRCGTCQQFFLAKTSRKTGTAYCSQRCAQNRNPAERTKDSRARRAVWGSIREDLERAIEQMRTLYQTTERKALAQGEAILQKAEHAFQNAYRRGAGPGYEDGKKLLVQAKRRIKQLQDKVKGY